MHNATPYPRVIISPSSRVCSLCLLIRVVLRRRRRIRRRSGRRRSGRRRKRSGKRRQISGRKRKQEE
jgi:hypothetical protein